MSQAVHATLPTVDLLREIYAFCEETGFAKTKFGEVAMGDTSFVAGIEKGRECRSSTVAKARSFMATYRANADSQAGAA